MHFPSFFLAYLNKVRYNSNKFQINSNKFAKIRRKIAKIAQFDNHSLPQTEILKLLFSEVGIGLKIA